MKYEHIDWACLRGGVLFFLGATVLGGSIMALGYYFERRMAQQHQLAQSQFQEISARYLAVDEEKALIKTYFSQFLRLNEIGVLGEEQRLNWIEVLGDAGDQVKLPALGYEITAQRQHTPGFPITLGRYSLFVSNMNLDMALLHEGDLFRLLGVLNARAHGRYTVSRCQLTRNFAEVTDNMDAANVNALCELQWFSVKLASGEDVKV